MDNFIYEEPKITDIVIEPDESIMDGQTGDASGGIETRPEGGGFLH